MARHIAVRWRDSLSHQSPKRAEKLQKLLQESARSLTMAADFARVRSAMPDQVLKAQGYGLPQVDIPAFPRLAPPQLDGIDFETSTYKARLGALRVANSGWTIPEWMAPGYIASFDRAPFKLIDAFFVERYLGGVSFKGRLRFTAEELLASPQLKPWKPLLRQIFQSIHAEKYVVCVPALLSVIEELLSDSLLHTLDLPRAHVEKGRWRGKQTVDVLVWSSAVAFLSHLFANANFDQPGPSKTRLPSPHDRAEKRWNRTDALKLVNALATLNWLVKPES